MIQHRIEWEPDPRQTLGRLRGGTQNRLIRRAITAGLKPIKRDLKSALRAHRLTGAAEKSIGQKVSTKRTSRSGKGGRTTGIVGPRADYRFQGKDGEVKAPFRYLHVLDKRTQVATNAFARNARSYLEVTRAKIEEGLAAELAKQR